MKNLEHNFEASIAYLQHVSASNNTIVEIKKQTLQQHAIASNTCIAIYNLASDEYDILHWIFQSDDSTVHNPMSRLAMEELVHTSDIEYCQKWKVTAIKLLDNIPADELMDYKLVYECRLKDHRGTFHRIIHQFMVLEVNEKGKIGTLRLQLDRVAAEDSETKPQGLHIINTRTRKKQVYHKETCLSEREIEIVKWLAEGYDSKRIAKKLFISENTVNNHRRKILLKTQTADTGKALLYARAIGLI